MRFAPFIFGLGLFGVAFLMRKDFLNNKSNGVKFIGKIVGVFPDWDNDGANWRPIVSYSPNGIDQVEFTSLSSRPANSWEVGANIGVSLLDGNPEIYDETFSRNSIVTFIFLGSIILLMSFI